MKVMIVRNNIQPLHTPSSTSFSFDFSLPSLHKKKSHQNHPNIFIPTQPMKKMKKMKYHKNEKSKINFDMLNDNVTTMPKMPMINENEIQSRLKNNRGRANGRFEFLPAITKSRKKLKLEAMGKLPEQRISKSRKYSKKRVIVRGRKLKGRKVFQKGLQSLKQNDHIRLSQFEKHKRKPKKLFGQEFPQFFRRDQKGTLLLISVMKFLNPHHVLCISLASKWVWLTLNDNELWKFFCIKNLPVKVMNKSMSVVNFGFWKRFYFQTQKKKILNFMRKKEKKKRAKRKRRRKKNSKNRIHVSESVDCFGGKIHINNDLDGSVDVGFSVVRTLDKVVPKLDFSRLGEYDSDYDDSDDDSC